MLLAYAMAKGEAENEAHLARIHISESLRLAPQGRYISTPLKDLLEPRKIDARNPAEVLSDLEGRGAFKVVRKNEPSRSHGQDRSR